MYIPLDILLVEPEQPIKEPVTMPLFEAATAAEPTGQNIPDVSVSPTTVEPTFEKLPEDFQNFSETSGNLPEKIDKEKKRKRKQRKVLLYPPTDYRRPHGGGSESFAFFHSVGEK